MLSTIPPRMSLSTAKVSSMSAPLFSCSAAEKALRDKLGDGEHDKLIANSLNKVVLH